MRSQEDTPTQCNSRRASKNAGFKQTLKQTLKQVKAENESLKLKSAEALASFEVRLAGEREAHQLKFNDLGFKLSTTLDSLADLTAKVEQLQNLHKSTEAQIVSQQASHRLEIDALKSKHESQLNFLEEQIKEASSANSQWQQQSFEKITGR